MVQIVKKDPEQWENDLDDDGLKEYKAQLPEWLYLLKPFSKEGTKLPIGSLQVKIVKGLNFPAMDMFGTSDPFCEIYLTQPDGEKKKQKTKKDMRTLNPQWDASFNFRVTTTLCNLRVDVFDYDATSDNDFIGYVEIPLSDLSHQTRVEKEYHLHLSDDAKLINAKVKRDKSKKNKQLQSDTGVVFSKKARIKLELTYRFSKVGEFASHFVYVPPEPKPEPKFDMDVFYNGAMDLMELLGPVFALLGEVNVVLTWSDPFKSICVLIPFVLSCLYPWMAPVVIQLWLIRYMFWQFVLVQWKTQEDEPKVKLDNDDPESKEELYDSDDEATEARKEAKRIEEKRKKERESHMDGLLVGMANSTMAGAGMKETLQWLQNLIVWINGMIKYVFGLFQWKNFAISRMIFIALCCSFLYSCFFPFSYIALVAGIYVICMNTVPFQMFYWVMMGLIFYLTRSKSKD
eukprot:TRINITY_DN392_c0_g1_i6.p1 TRINITY_DN392_c0_g1~~TRINITY_DN392_c0_g1_i6.p1  ORF type:complete len:476 (-),score=106.72 TRINITY_DN392_c0_g1_i6:49-1425(-)